MLALPLSTIGLPLPLYLALYYAGALQFPLVVIGPVMLVGRFSDMVIDPLLGVASDAWGTRFGLRKPWWLSAGRHHAFQRYVEVGF